MSRVTEVWENRAAIFNRRNALLTLIGFGVIWGAVRYCNRQPSGPAAALPPRDGAGEATPTDGGFPTPVGAVPTEQFVPEIVWTGGPDGNGVFTATLYRTILAQCVKINNPVRWYDNSMAERNYDPTLPTITSGIAALSVPGMGVDGVDEGPYYLARGFYLSPVSDLQDHSWSMLDTGSGVCIEDKN